VRREPVVEADPGHVRLLSVGVGAGWCPAAHGGRAAGQLRSGTTNQPGLLTSL
jgi:hypothetical protein